ncbi:MAG TPA: hypothetical protein VNP92_08690 [Actinophytocola sp.]|nr:hypothetical protein [Actinophytocola sp.]
MRPALVLGCGVAVFTQLSGIEMIIYYSLFNVAAWLFVYVRMPDLTGRSREESENKFSEGKFRPADFAR